MFKDLVFYGFSIVLIAAALGVITARNPVHAALLLVLAFFTAAGIWVLLKAEFLAISLVLVYVGAVMVLFLFVVMMLDVNLDKLREGFWKNSWLGMTVGVAMLLEMAFLLMSPAFSAPEPANPASAQPGYSNIKELGRLIYTEYAFPFELAALILLVAIVAAIALTLRGRKDAKSQDPSRQVRVKARDRLRIVQMPAVPRDGAPDKQGEPK
ncbi:MAG: NADH-quinone oxidoreductase subunit J [Burkholderiales bacterium]|nr:NADH-quinone oxidoreductase subunit J [Burkholderiales bacterium]